MTALSDLISMLDELEASLPALWADYPDEGDFWSAFAGQADVIEDAAGEHHQVVHLRMEEMLGPVRLRFGSATQERP